MNTSITKRDALIVIDIQNDFCPGGSLAVADGDSIIPGVLDLAEAFDTIVMTQDWHPKDHASFAETHGLEPFSSVELPYGSQTLWPDHCVQGTFGAEFHTELHSAVNASCAIVRKGMNPDIDSYSAFYENDKTTVTGLTGYLKSRGIERVFLVGLAYDFCVAYSALDAVKDGFEAVVVKDLCRSIGMPVDNGRTTVDVMEDAFASNGVVVVDAQSLEDNPKQRFPF